MAPTRKKGANKVASTAAARRQWKVGDLVLAKVKGFPAWPATVGATCQLYSNIVLFSIDCAMSILFFFFVGRR